MIHALTGLALHRYPRNGDRLRIYASNGSFIAEAWARIEGWGTGATVRFRGGNPHIAIRRDQFQWSSRFSCWSYQYSE
jgi:hypothetical protein